jgi:hypothetical protein
MAYVLSMLDFYSGVVSLVALSVTVMSGLLSMARRPVRPQDRVRLQLMHRGFAAVAVVFLLVHVGMQLLAGRIGAVPPLLVTLSGMLRGRFAYGDRPGLWRAIHATAYLSWPVAVLHGLKSGRPAATWVILSYLGCLGGVAVCLLVRSALRRRARGRVPAAPTMPVAAHRPTETAPRHAATVRPEGSEANERNYPVFRFEEDPAPAPAPEAVASDEDFWAFMRSGATRG